jgi:oxygen-independent coproporphyrinogen-3 oxidase
MTSPALPGLYVHVPFCGKKCAYCDFYSIEDPAWIGPWTVAVGQEAALYAAAFHCFDTLYVGGGTPSRLAEDHLAALLRSLRGRFHFAPDAEITLEANPDDVTTRKLALWRDLGINRLSLGVQSFNDQELAFLGRRHSAAQALAAITAARAAGFDNLSLDFIYALPGQTETAWRRTVSQAAALAPEHLSCYQLTVAPHTPLAAGAVSMPSEETQAKLFLLTSRLLRSQGYSHYEVANFARAEARRCRHNLKYWRHEPYLGLGPAAHSFLGRRRWWNAPAVEEYCRRLGEGEKPLAGEENLTPAQLRLEAMLLGFRTQEGAPLELLRTHPGWEASLDQMVHRRQVLVQAGRVRPTARGYLVADRLPREFMD